MMRIEWGTVKASEDSGRDCVLFLPHAGRLLLLSIFDRLEWEATYRVDGYDFADWDELQAIVQDTKHGLTRRLFVDEIVLALNEIRDAIVEKQCESDGENIDALAAILALISPELAVLVQGVNAIENAIGGDWEPAQ